MVLLLKMVLHENIQDSNEGKLYVIWNFAELGIFRVQNFRNFWEIDILKLKMVLHENFQYLGFGKNCILYGINLN